MTKRVLVLCAMIVVLGCDTRPGISEPMMRDFADNPAKFKGKTMTMLLEYKGRGLAGGMDNGVLNQELDAPFRASGFVSDNWFSFNITINIPAGTKLPPLRSLENAVVRFVCTEGSLDYGNRAIEVVRP